MRMGLAIDLALVGSKVSACAGVSIRARMRDARRRARGGKRIFMKNCQYRKTRHEAVKCMLI